MTDTTTFAARRLAGIENVADLAGLPELHISDGADPQGDNDARASFAAKALVHYCDVVAGDEDIETTLSDLLGDLRHLCDALGLDFADLSGRGAYHYDAELTGEL